MTQFNPRHMISPVFLAGVIEDRPNVAREYQGYIGQRLCPWMEVPERQITWDVVFQENNLAGIYDPRGEAIPGDDILYSSILATLADVKSSRVLESWTLQHFNEPGMAQVYTGTGDFGRSIEAKLRREIAKKIGQCDDEIDTMYEYFTMRSLQGSIEWPPKDASGNTIASPMQQWNPNLAVSISYPLPSNFNQAVTALTGYDSETTTNVVWSNHSSAAPLDNMRVINRLVKRTTGSSLRGGVVLMGESTFNHMAQCTEVLNWVAGANKEQPDARRYIDYSEIENIVKTKTGWSIELYDASWTYRTDVPGTKPTVTQVPFLDEGKVLFLPRATGMGSMLTTKLQTAPGVGAGWAYGKVPWSYEAPKPPYDVELGINAVMIPQYLYYDWFVLDVLN